TALRMLHTLLLRRYAYQEPDTLRYGLTLGFARIGALVSENLRLRDVAHPLLAELSQACRESVCLAVEEDMEVLYVDVLDGPDGMLKITQRIGKRAPMHCTGIGKVLLSGYTPQALDRFVRRKGLPKLTEHTLVTPQALGEELARIAAQGYALDDEECELGALCIATGIYDYITCPSARMTPDRMRDFAPLIRRTAAKIGQHLGGR
ncbi:MAG TPA: IclR family transcriptional regulator, partial [Clostridia bacterium]|nr:IclR family transcriptional regulator [Clostridia bacterium]